MKSTSIINNFNGGEINSDLLDYRTDIDKYRTSCKLLQNALPLVEGGARKLPGTYYVDGTKTNQLARLAKFQFNTDQNYVIEFTDQLIRILTEDGVLQSAAGSHSDYDPTHAYVTDDKVLAGIYWKIGFAGSKYLHVCMPYGAYVNPEQKIDDFFIFAVNSIDTLELISNGTQLAILLADTTASKNTAVLIQALIRSVGTFNGTDLSAVTVTPNAAYYAAPVVTTMTSWSVNLYSTGVYKALQNNQHCYFPPEEATYWVISTADAEGDIEIATPYAEADLFDLDVQCQKEDTLYIFHPDYAPRALRRTSATTWVLSTPIFIGTPELSKYGENYTVKIISGITQANPPVVTAFNHGFNTGDTIYLAGIIGMVELNKEIFTITKVDEDSFSLDDINSTSFTAYSSGGYAIRTETLFGAANKYPACGTIFEQRLVVGGSYDFPQRIYGSAIGDHTFMVSDPEADDYAFIFDLASNQLNRLRWMKGHNSLMCGSSGGIKSLMGSAEEPLSQSNVNTREATTIGAAPVPPEIVNDSLLWLTRSKTILRMSEYLTENEKWVSPDLTRLARHIMKGSNAAGSGIKQMAFMGDPYPILWCLRNDGVLLGFTYEQTEQVYAWFRFVTDGTVESIACISNDENEDRLWMVVKRTINSSDVYLIEYMKPFEIYSTIADGFFVHSGLTYSGVAATTISGLDHLEGEALDVLADGVSVGPLTVASGDITLDTAATKVHAGLPYDTIIEPMNPAIDMNVGTSKSKKQKINRIAIAVFESLGGQIGPDSAHLEDIPYTSSDALNTEEITNIALHADWEEKATIYIKHSDPYPFTIKGIVPDLQVNEYGLS